MFLKTPLAARELQVSHGLLWSLLRAEKIPPPTRDISGHYLWSEADLARARAAMKIDRRRKERRRARPA